MVFVTTFTIIENTDLMSTIIFSNLSCIVIFTTTEKNPPYATSTHTSTHMHTHLCTHARAHVCTHACTHMH